jgi:integrase
MAGINRAWSRQRVINDCACWPDEAERARWLDLFADDHMEKTWARETAYQNAGVYSRYFLLTGETEVTPRGLKAFVALCEMGAMKRKCCPRTVAGYVAAIYKILRLLHPENDYAALGRITTTMLSLAARTPKRRTAAVGDAVELIRFGWRLIDRGRKIRRANRERGTLLFRTGLHILMGLYMPERLRAFASLEVGQVDLDGGLIVFRADQTKNRREIARPLPSDLIPVIREWLEIRLAFMPDHDLFWISLKTGAAAVPATLYAAMRAETSDPADFPSPVTPHPLRNAAASFIVRHAPEKATLVSPILGQLDAKLAGEYIEGAGMIEASRDAAHIIMSSGEAPKIDRRRGPRRYRRGKLVLTPRAQSTSRASASRMIKVSGGCAG